MCKWKKTEICFGRVISHDLLLVWNCSLYAHSVLHKTDIYFYKFMELFIFNTQLNSAPVVDKLSHWRHNVPTMFLSNVFKHNVLNTLLANTNYLTAIFLSVYQSLSPPPPKHTHPLILTPTHILSHTLSLSHPHSRMLFILCISYPCYFPSGALVDYFFTSPPFPVTYTIGRIRPVGDCA